MAEQCSGIVHDTFAAHTVTRKAGGVGTAVALPRCIFDEAYVRVDPDTGAAVSSQEPVLSVRLSDLTGTPSNADTFTVGAITYKTMDIQPDGVNSVLYFLKRVRT